ncbi:hypothetical protein E4U42_000846 [Claviceps africana]|uniref:Extracellular protein n=1 Tax=Claviceps africana TaxID=83212 RepID=A0A8K0IZS2_9HYPO|nr:hypothetical protein E4U42_000846 [Claviceps africana]
MKTLLSTVLTVLSLAGPSRAHMQMSNPPPLLSKFNKYTTSPDHDMTSPLHADGSNFPCKNYQRFLGTPQGQPVAQWTPGKSYSLTVTGGAAHNGGSCQASLSFDKGASWKVIHSYIGNCPVQGESTYGFTLPGDTPPGTALFAWTWFNKLGNREMYMNCAVVDVAGGGGEKQKKKKKKRGTAAALAARPVMFVANVANGCSTVEGKDVMFPSPGPDVDLQSKSPAPPSGQCGAYSSPPPSSSPPGGPSSPVSGSGSGSGAKSPPGKPSAHTPRPPPPNSPPRGPDSVLDRPGVFRPLTASPPPASSGSCKPGSFQCTTSPSGDGWQVCDTSTTWVIAGSCGPGQVCKFNAANGSPYCVPPGFQFP